MNTLAPSGADASSAVSSMSITDGFQPRGAMQLAKLVFTALPLLRFFSVLGLLLLVVAAIGSMYSKMFTFGVAMWACVAALGIPYLGAVPQLRRLLANQRLLLLPGFAFTCVVLLLLLTTLLAVYMPLAMWLAGLPQASPTLGMRAFTIATLYSVFTYIGMSTRHGQHIFSLLPLMFVGALNVLNTHVPGWWQQPVVVFGSFGASVALWAWALVRFRGRQRFSPLTLGLMQSGSSTDYHHQIAFQPWLYRLRQMPAAATLLLGYPGSWRGRAQSLGFSLILMPMACATLVWILDRNDKRNVDWLQMFLLCHLVVTAFLPFAWGELAARTRWLWLRHGSQRPMLWTFIEGQLWRSFLLMLGCSVSLIVLSTFVVDAGDQRRLLLTLLLALSVTLHSGYYSVMARLRHWAAWLQIIYILALTALLSLGAFAMRQTMPDAWALVSAPTLLGLALLYRMLAQRAFLQVDWLRLKPQVLSRNTAAG